MKRNLLDLPTEVILTIISFLTDREIVELQRTCHHCNNICQSGSIWRCLAIRQYGPLLLPLSNKHAEHFYKSILVKYGCLLGTWVRQDYPFGGLLDVKFQDSSVVGSTWRPHPDLGRPLKKTGLFAITCRDGQVCVNCTIDKRDQSHTCQLELQEGTGRESAQFQTMCQKPCAHRGSCSFYLNVWNRNLNEY